MWIHMHCPCLQVDKKSFFTKTDLFHTIHNNENWWLHDSVPLFAPYIANGGIYHHPLFFMEPHFGKFRCTYSMKLWIIVAKHDSPRMLRNRRFSPKHRSVRAAQFKAIHYVNAGCKRNIIINSGSWISQNSLSVGITSGAKCLNDLWPNFC